MSRLSLRAAAAWDAANPVDAGATYDVGGGWKAGLNLSRSVRAPSIEELFANGPHGGNASFQIGDPDLGIERSLGFEASIKHKSRVLDAGVTLYGSRYGNFLYEAPTGVIRDNLPVYEARQGRASYVGFEAQADAFENAANDFGVERHVVVVIAGAGRGARRDGRARPRRSRDDAWRGDQSSFRSRIQGQRA